MIVLQEKDLVEQLQQVAVAQATSTEALLNQAVTEFLENCALQKIQEETAAFERMHAQLVTQYLGQHVAIHLGELVDHDLDLLALRRRIRQRFGRLPILLRAVTPERELPELIIRRPRLVPASAETTK